MVIQSLKAQIAALTEAMKEKGVPEKVLKTLQESTAGLQKLLDKAREAAKEANEAGKPGEEEDGEEAEVPEPGHTVTTTHKVKHDGPVDEDGDGDEKDEDKDEDSKESKRGYIQSLLKEAGIPKELWSLEKLARMSLAEAKAEIEEKKALLETVRKQVAKDIDLVPMSTGEPLHESNGEANLNSLFTGCAQ